MAPNLARYERVSIFNRYTNSTSYQSSTDRFDAKRKEIMKTWDIVEYIVREAIPMILIFILAIALLIKLKTVRQERKKLTSGKSDARKVREQRLYVTSIAVAIVIFMCLVPVDVVYLIVKFRPEIFFPVDHRLYVSVMFCLSLLHSLMYSLNFVIFILSSPTFRTHLATRCRCMAASHPLDTVANNAQIPTIQRRSQQT